MFIKCKKIIKCKYELVNSICIVDDDIYYVSAANNAVVRYSLSSEQESIIAGNKCGYSSNSFREPVHIFADKIIDGTHLFVSDWHNHRVVKFINGQYVTEFGFYGPAKNLIMNIALFLRGFANPGGYIHSHFGHNVKKYTHQTSFFKNSLYFFYSIFKVGFKRLYPINKPNGICQFKHGYLLTQKNRNCLTFFDINLKPIKDIPILESGRIGNVNSLNGKTIFCVESIGKVYEINKDEIIRELEITHNELNFKPFSAIYLGKDYMGVIAQSVFYVFKYTTGEKIGLYKTDGELHGINVVGSDVYLTDRLNSVIYILEILND